MKRFSVATSFPGEYRKKIVAKVADQLANEYGRDRVLYDDFHKAEFARPNLDVHLLELYGDHSHLIVVFLCAEYEEKEWCGLEMRAIRSLIKGRQDDRLMFLRLDNAPVSGILDIDGYVDIAGWPPSDVAKLIQNRVDGKSSRPGDFPTTEGQVYLPQIRRPPTELEQRRFLRESFTIICEYFKQAGGVFEKSDTRVNLEFSQPDLEKLRCELYLDGKLVTGCRIWIGSERFDSGIHYFQGRVISSEFNARNETLGIDFSGAGDELLLRGLLGGSQSDSIERADPRAAAQILWRRFVKQLES